MFANCKQIDKNNKFHTTAIQSMNLTKVFAKDSYSIGTADGVTVRLATIVLSSKAWVQSRGNGK